MELHNETQHVSLACCHSCSHAYGFFQSSSYIALEIKTLENNYGQGEAFYVGVKVMLYVLNKYPPSSFIIFCCVVVMPARTEWVSPVKFVSSDAVLPCSLCYRVSLVFPLLWLSAFLFETLCLFPCFLCFISWCCSVLLQGVELLTRYILTVWMDSAAHLEHQLSERICNDFSERDCSVQCLCLCTFWKSVN